MAVPVPRPVRRLVVAALALVSAFVALAGLPGNRAEAASPYAYYAERQRGDTLTIKHSPAPGIVVRNVRRKLGVGHRLRTHRAIHHRVVRRHRVGHRRLVRRTRVRNVADPAIAGFCRDGGTWLKPGPMGRPRIVQREICDSVAAYSLNPNDPVVRPDKSSPFPF